MRAVFPFGTPAENAGIAPTGRLERAGFFLVLLLFAATHLQGIREAYLAGHQGFNGALRSIIGRNYARYGFFRLRLLPVKNVGPLTDDTPRVVHWHHPPLVHMLVGVSFLVFGEKEAAARAVPILFSLLSVVLLWRIARRQWGAAGGLLAAAAFCLFPLEIEYGAMPNYEAPVIALMLGAVWSVLVIRETGAPWAKALLFAFTALAGFTDWPAFILAAFAGAGLILDRPRRWWLFVAYGFFCVLWLLLIWRWLDAFSDAGGLAGLARWRAGHTAPVAMGLWWQRFFLRLKDYVGWPFLTLAAVGLAAHAFRFRRLPFAVGVFGLGGMLYLLVFRHGSWVHVFFLSYLLPALAVLAAAGAVGIGRAAAAAERALVLRVRDKLSASAGFGRVLASLSRFSLRRPAVLAGLLALAWMVWMVSTQIRLMEKAHLVSREIAPSWDGRRPPLPYASRLDAVLLAKTARSMSRPGDVVAVHPRTVSSPQFRYYLDRASRVERFSSRLHGARLYVVPERQLSEAEKKHFLEGHRVVSLLRYWIVDLESAAPSFERRTFVVQPTSRFWRFFVSSLYPPHRMRTVSH